VLGYRGDALGLVNEQATAAVTLNLLTCVHHNEHSQLLTVTSTYRAMGRLKCMCVHRERPFASALPFRQHRLAHAIEEMWRHTLGP